MRLSLWVLAVVAAVGVGVGTGVIVGVAVPAAVAVGAGVVLHAHLDGLVRDLNHLEVVLHLLFEQLMVQNHDSAGLDC